jgi:hypothetical protein
VEAWINPDSVPNDYQAILFQGTAFADRFAVYLKDNTTLSIWRDGTEQLISIENIVGRWSHVAVAVDRSISTNNVRVYLNGALIQTVSATGGDGAGDPFYIGVDGRAGFPYPFGGEIDQVKVWSAALSASQVQESMHVWAAAGVTGSPGLLAHYDFNDNTQATTLRDMVGSQNLTITNATTGRYVPIVVTSTSGGQELYRFTRSYLTATGGWTVPSGVDEVDVVVVGGGGGLASAGGDPGQGGNFSGTAVSFGVNGSGGGAGTFSGDAAPGGIGGNSQLGGSVRGRTFRQGVSRNAVGLAGILYGGGGGGATADSTEGADLSGGAGANGIVIVELFA